MEPENYTSLSSLIVKAILANKAQELDTKVSEAVVYDEELRKRDNELRRAGYNPYQRAEALGVVIPV